MTPEIQNERYRKPDLLKKMVYSYFLNGSAEKTLLRGSDEFPKTVNTFHTIMDELGIVEFAGRHSRLSEAIYFFSHLLLENVPLESLYKEMSVKFRTSLPTLYRIFNRVRNGIVGRTATALFITPSDNKYLTLVGNDVSTPRLDVGKPFGALTVPACFSRRLETTERSILRVLQQEVFTDLAIEEKIPKEIISQSPTRFMALDITDVRVFVYHISIPPYLCGNVSSPKLSSLRFMSVSELVSGNEGLRAGMQEMGMGYKNFVLHGNQRPAGVYLSALNKNLINLTTETVPNY